MHQNAESMLVAYVDRHGAAYAWAERRRIEAHPRTGAVQIVEVRERVAEIAPPATFDLVVAEAPATLAAQPQLFATLGDDALLSVGVPADWLGDVRDRRELLHAGRASAGRSLAWEKEGVFLQASQRDLTDRSFGGPARVAGSAGMGKTIVAIHRAVRIAREHPGARVLLASFSQSLADADPASHYLADSGATVETRGLFGGALEYG